MQLELSPTIQVNQFLRLQRARKRAYRDWFDAVYEQGWKSGKVTGGALRNLAVEYQCQLTEAGAFDVEQRGSPDLLMLRTARSFDIESKALWPIGLGSRVQDAEEAYAEEAVMLQRLSFSFANKKVVASEAPLNFAVTRHCLERMIERGAVSGHIEQAFPAIALGLTADVALALANGIAKERGPDDWARGAFVPHAGGLMVITNRLWAGPLYAQDFGWRFNFTKRRYSDGYLKKDLFDPNAHGMNGGTIVSVWFATTFLSRDQLSSEQREYVEAFGDWRAKASPEAMKLSFDIQFNPDFVYRPERIAAPDDEAGRQVEQLIDMVQHAAFKLHSREAIAPMVEADMTTRALRSSIRKHAQAATG